MLAMLLVAFLRNWLERLFLRQSSFSELDYLATYGKNGGEEIVSASGLWYRVSLISEDEARATAEAGSFGGQRCRETGGLPLGHMPFSLFIYLLRNLLSMLIFDTNNFIAIV